MARKEWTLDAGTGRVIVILGQDLAEGDRKGNPSRFESNYARWCENAGPSAALLAMHAAACARPGAKPIARADLSSPDVKKQFRQALDRRTLVVLEGPAVAAAVAAPPRDEKTSGSPVAKTKVSPVIEIDADAVVVKRSYTSPKRRAVRLSTDVSVSDGQGELSVSVKDKIQFFKVESGGTALSFNAVDNVFSGSDLSRGVTLYAEGLAASDSVGDVVLTLALSGCSKPMGGPAKDKLTSVELTLDLGMSRDKPGAEPTSLSSSDKNDKGRCVHVQYADTKHGRAMLLVHKAKPEAYAGKLAVVARDERVTLFEKERPAKGDKPAGKQDPGGAWRCVLENGAIGKGGTKLWVQGAIVSTSQRDTGFMLGLEGIEDDGDRVAVTVVSLADLKARVPVTPGKRNPGEKIKEQVFSAGLVPYSSEFLEEDFEQNPVRVLVSGSLPAKEHVSLSVKVTPRDTPVTWSVQRYAGPDKDGSDVTAASPNPVPTLTPDGAGKPSAQLAVDAVGTFWVRAFVDCNGTGQVDVDGDGKKVDAEPFIVLNLVLVQLGLRVDLSTPGERDYDIPKASRDPAVPDGNNFEVAVADGTSPEIAGAMAFKSGLFKSGRSGVVLEAQVDVLGGGSKGRRGIEWVCAGWVNNDLGDLNASVAEFSDEGQPGLTLATVMVKDGSQAKSKLFGLPLFHGVETSNRLHPPFLDAGARIGSTEDRVRDNELDLGGAAICLRHASPDPKDQCRLQTAKRAEFPPPVGDRYVVTAIDSPLDCAPITSLDVDGGSLSLVSFRLNMAFRAYLCVWTLDAERLYSVLEVVGWKVSGSWSIDLRAEAAKPIAYTARPEVVLDTPESVTKLTPASSTDIEVRRPVSLQASAKYFYGM
jgi:hypothetical protein